MTDRWTSGDDRREAPGLALVKWGALGVISALVAGALYLLVARGPALKLDLAAMSKYLVCF